MGSNAAKSLVESWAKYCKSRWKRSARRGCGVVVVEGVGVGVVAVDAEADEEEWPAEEEKKRGLARGLTSGRRRLVAVHLNVCRSSAPLCIFELVESRVELRMNDEQVQVQVAASICVCVCVCVLVCACVPPPVELPLSLSLSIHLALVFCYFFSTTYSPRLGYSLALCSHSHSTPRSCPNWKRR